ncbi:hypothetical protein MKW92_036056, partial [Papaver armeniacum]
MLADSRFSTKKGKGFSRRELQGNISALASAVSRLEKQIQTSSQYTRYQIEGKAESELEALKSEAESDLEEARQALTTMQNESHVKQLDGEYYAPLRAGQDKSEQCLSQEQAAKEAALQEERKKGGSLKKLIGEL